MSTKDVKCIESNDSNEIASEVALEAIITNAIKIPGVKVDRDRFLAEFLVKETNDIQLVLDEGPIVAGIDEKRLKRIAEKLILDRTAKSSISSFVMGIPGGLAMVATVPADILQFYGMTLKLAQELTYLYGAKDLWQDGKVDEDLVKNQLLLYCGVMFGVAGASSGVRLLSTQLAKTALKKLPQRALTKTFWYPIIKQIGKGIGIKVTKTTVASGASKAIPVIGGVVAGAMTFASMKPMAEKLLNVLEEANFNYTEEKFNSDIEIVGSISENDKAEVETPAKDNSKQSLLEKGKEKIGNFFKKKETQSSQEDELDKIKKLKELLDIGAISQEEYDLKKKEILGV